MPLSTVRHWRHSEFRWVGCRWSTAQRTHDLMGNNLFSREWTGELNDDVQLIKVSFPRSVSPQGTDYNIKLFYIICGLEKAFSRDLRGLCHNINIAGYSLYGCDCSIFLWTGFVKYKTILNLIGNTV